MTNKLKLASDLKKCLILIKVVCDDYVPSLLIRKSKKIVILTLLYNLNFKFSNYYGQLCYLKHLEYYDTLN